MLHDIKYIIISFGLTYNNIYHFERYNRGEHNLFCFYEKYIRYIMFHDHIILILPQLVTEQNERFKNRKKYTKKEFSDMIVETNI